MTAYSHVGCQSEEHFCLEIRKSGTETAKLKHTPKDQLYYMMNCNKKNSPLLTPPSRSSTTSSHSSYCSLYRCPGGYCGSRGVQDPRHTSRGDQRRWGWRQRIRGRLGQFCTHHHCQSHGGLYSFVNIPYICRVQRSRLEDGFIFVNSINWLQGSVVTFAGSCFVF